MMRVFCSGSILEDSRRDKRESMISGVSSGFLDSRESSALSQRRRSLRSSDRDKGEVFCNNF